jgi:transcriptional regulator GlxA family with amidase domain
MAYNRRVLLQEMVELVSSTPRIGLNEIARRLQVDRHTIENAMRADKHMSFREYRREEMLRIAREMLSQSAMSVKEVGLKLPFCLAMFSGRCRETSDNWILCKLKARPLANLGILP